MGKSLQLLYANVAKLSKTVGVVHKKCVQKIRRSVIVNLPNPLLLPPYWPLLLADFRSVLFPLPHLLVYRTSFSCKRSRTNDLGKRCMLYNIDICHSKLMDPGRN